jgi:hypothetical protein
MICSPKRYRLLAKLCGKVEITLFGTVG